jgi:GntR family transcriptional regulator, transcriptional repressor for pyruvate dehydrogenase complex
MDVAKRGLARSTLAEQVASHLRDHIAKNQLRPGDPLPAELELSQALGVSRGIVREASRLLVAAGLINVASGRRSRVQPLQDRVIKGFFDHALATEQATTLQVLEMRQALEVAAAGHAARRRDPDDIARLEKIAQALREHVEDIPRFVEYDVRFHLALADATGNPFFKLFLSSIREIMAQSMKVGLISRRSQREIDVSLEAHEEIFERVRAGEPEAAEHAMRRHFADAVEAIATELVAPVGGTSD